MSKPIVIFYLDQPEAVSLALLTEKYGDRFEFKNLRNYFPDTNDLDRHIGCGRYEPDQKVDEVCMDAAAVVWQVAPSHGTPWFRRLKGQGYQGTTIAFASSSSMLDQCGHGAEYKLPAFAGPGSRSLTERIYDCLPQQ